MTTYHEKVLKAVKEINKRIRILREALFKAVEEGVQSASLFANVLRRHPRGNSAFGTGETTTPLWFPHWNCP